MIETDSLQLVPCELSHFEAILQDERKLTSLLKISLAEGWLGFDAARDAIRPCYEHLKSHPEVLGWWIHLFIHKPNRILVGVGGFKGLVNVKGKESYEAAKWIKLLGFSSFLSAAD